MASSMRSVEITLPTGGDDDLRSSSSQNSIKSVTKLLEEAKQMHSPEDRKAYNKKKASKEKLAETSAKGRGQRGEKLGYCHQWRVERG